MSLSETEFEQYMAALPVLWEGVGGIAVGVSGGPDSMALCHLLSLWAARRGIEVHAVTVDHGLRAEAAAEAEQVERSVAEWTSVQHTVLRWEGDKPQTRILEEARQARYAIIENYMKQHGIRHLFVAHHQDDQAETFLIRLAKGSGLDGLAAMLPAQDKGGGVVICRPLLSCAKDDLVAYCRQQEIWFIDDPTNENPHYLRPRLRAARDILEEEGLSSKRLSVTAGRMARARKALEELSSRLFGQAKKDEGEDYISFDWNRLRQEPDELILRVLLIAVEILQPGRDYAPRMERMENLLLRLLTEKDFKSATLSGCLFALNRKVGVLRVGKEKA